MPQRIVLGMGAGKCGLNLLAEILQNQPGTRVTCEQRPLLPWNRNPALPGIRERIDRWTKSHSESIVGDVAAFYLPYVEEAIAYHESIRIICLKRRKQEVVSLFAANIDSRSGLQMDYWSETPSKDSFQDPVWTQTFPQYPASDLEDALERYWDEYYQRADLLAEQFPSHFLLIDANELTETAGVRRVLDFVGIPQEKQVPIVGSRPRGIEESTKPFVPPARDPLDPKRCVVLVPFNGFIHPECDDSLKELERRGYCVRRISGYAAIDQGRNQIATDALIDGFDETLWIDSDIGFHPDEVERLRSHSVPIVSGIYPQKGRKELACHILPGTPNVTFGDKGGLIELLYGATGFMLVRREAYLTIQRKLQLPVCNERFNRPTIPFFLPMVRPIEDGHWYLAEDYSFCERARRCGFKIYADTRIRLWHVGWYRYGWEDSGIDRPRFNSFTLNLAKPSNDQPASESAQTNLKRFTELFQWPPNRPVVPSPPECDGLRPGTKQALSDTVPRNASLMVDVGCWLGRSTRFLCDLAPQSRVIAIDHWKGSPEHEKQTDLEPPLPILYETFLAEMWNYRDRIIPVRGNSVDGMQKVAAAGLVPDVVYLDADHQYDRVLVDLSAALDLFPRSRIVGDDWDWEGVRFAVQKITQQHGLRVETFDTAWRIVR